MLALERDFHRVEQLPVEEDECKGMRRSVGLKAQGYLDQSDHAEELMGWLKKKGLWTFPEPISISQVFLGEYPWAAAFKQYDIETLGLTTMTLISLIPLSSLVPCIPGSENTIAP